MIALVSPRIPSLVLNLFFRPFHEDMGPSCHQARGFGPEHVQALTKLGPLAAAAFTVVLAAGILFIVAVT